MYSETVKQTARVAATRRARRGFTLVELLVALAIVALLAGLLLPVLVRAKSQAQGMSCLNNLRQLQATMFLYAADNNDLVVWNSSYVKRSWVYSGDYGLSIGKPQGMTNTQWLIDPQYAAYADYIHATSIYKCPGDKTTVLIGGRTHPWVRSYGASFRQRRMADFDKVFTPEGLLKSPAMMITFGDVHPGYLAGLLYRGANQDGSFVSFPAYWHNGAGALAFADGHVDLRRWVDPRTRRPLSERMAFDSTATSVAIPSPGNRDAGWLYDHSSGGVPFSAFDIQDPDIYRASGGGSFHDPP